MSEMDGYRLGCPRSIAKPVQSLSRELKERTVEVHRAAERSGFIADMLTGKASRHGYALFLANLLPAYEALEQEDIAGDPRPKLRRVRSIESDLLAISGPGWRHELMHLPVAFRYAARIRASRDGDGALAVAHAYTRYLGDLSGGAVLGRLLKRHLGLLPHQLSFYAFPAIADIAAYKEDYRRALDALDLDAARISQIADEAIAAFEFNIELSLAVQAAAGASVAG